MVPLGEKPQPGLCKEELCLPGRVPGTQAHLYKTRQLMNRDSQVAQW